MKIPKDILRDYTTFRRMWDIFFHIASIRRSVPLDEIFQLFDGKWHIKTIRRDLQLLEDYGIWKVPTEPHGIACYRFEGSPGPFTRQPGKKWCVSCRDFVKIEEFGLQRTSIDGRAHACKPCKNTILKRYYRRNRKYHLNRQKRYYRSKVKRQLLEAGMMFTPQIIPLLHRH